MGFRRPLEAYCSGINSKCTTSGAACSRTAPNSLSRATSTTATVAAMTELSPVPSARRQGAAKTRHEGAGSPQGHCRACATPREHGGGGSNSVNLGGGGTAQLTEGRAEPPACYESGASLCSVSASASRVPSFFAFRGRKAG